MIIVVCGVSGTGKTTIGRLLAAELKVPFHDADDFHPASNKDKMACGTPLTDEDRKPWLERLAGALPKWQIQGGAVLACSALKDTYRSILESRALDIEWVVLTASEEVLKARLSSRKDHFFDQRLLSSQLEAFEFPDYGLTLDVSESPKEIVNTILARLIDD